MKSFRISFFLLSVFCASPLVARVALKREVRLYDAGRISGQAEAIFKYMADDSEKKKELLTQLSSSARQLSLPDLGAKIDALGSLTAVQLEQNNAYMVSTARELPKTVTAELSGGETVQVSWQDIRSYGLGLIAKARTYTDLFSIEGVPSIADHRHASFTLFADKAQEDKGIAAQAHEAVAAHKKIAALLAKDDMFVRFLNTFKNHMRKRYDFASNGLEAELLFKVFENLTYGFLPEADLGATLARFIETHNGYVAQDMRLTSAELAFPAGEWARSLLSATLMQLKKQVLFALSLAMEGIKKEVKREPVIKRLKDAVAAHAKELKAMLAADNVSLSSAEQQQPMALALRSSEYVQKVLEESKDAGDGSRAERAQRYIALVDEINFLMKDYDVVARDMADAQALARVRADVQRLPEQEQRVLAAASSLSSDEMDDEALSRQALPGSVDENESDEAGPTDGSPGVFEPEEDEYDATGGSGKKSGKVAAIVTAILVVIAAAVFWKFKDKVGGILKGFGLGKGLSRKDVDESFESVDRKHGILSSDRRL